VGTSGRKPPRWPRLSWSCPLLLLLLLPPPPPASEVRHVREREREGEGEGERRGGARTGVENGLRIL
jgi:hypothetical protein